MKLPEGWTEHLIYRSGQKVAFLWVKDNEIHCFRLESATGCWMKHQDIERLLGPILKQYGHLITKVRQNNQTGHKFVTRMGFAETNRDDANIYYKAERLNHARL